MKLLSDLAPRWEPLVILLLLVAASAAAQTPPRDPTRPAQAPTRDGAPIRRTGTAVLKGRVVDGVTGAAISRARVRMMGGSNTRSAVLTDGEGSFTFPGLVAGQFTVTVEKSAYMPVRYPESRTLRGRLLPTTIADGEALEIAVKLFRGGVIAGRVTDSYGDPVDFAQVQVMALPRGRPPVMRNASPTNDLGEFRVPRLEAGRYILSVVPRNPMMMEEPGPATSTTPLPQPTPVYYPGAASAEQAQAIVLNRGQIVSGIEIVLGEGVPSIINGSIAGPDGLMTKMNGSVMARFSTGTPNMTLPMTSAPIRPDGTFRMQLVPGAYTLEARMNPQMGPGDVYQQSRELFGMLPLSIAPGQTETVVIMVGRGATASGRILFEGTSPAPAAPVGRGMRPPIFSEGPEACRTGEAAIAADWTFKIDALVGTCSTPTGSMFGRWHIKSIKVGGVNALQKPVTFEPGRHYNDVEIVVTDRPTQLDVQVAGDDGQLTKEYVALAFPQDKSLWKQGTRVVRNLVPRPIGSVGATTAVNSTMMAGGGSRDFITNLFPGEYYVISLDDIDAEDALDPGVLEQLASHATRVTVGAESSNQVSLQRLKAADIIR